MSVTSANGAEPLKSLVNLFKGCGVQRQSLWSLIAMSESPSNAAMVKKSEVTDEKEAG